MSETKQKRRAGTIIFDDLAFKLTPSERIVFGIIHRFAGYKLGECRLKPNKIAEMAGVSRSTVYNATNHLIRRGMIRIVRHQKSSGAFYRALQVIDDSGDRQPVLSGDKIDELETIQATATESIYSVKEPETYGDKSINALMDFWLDEVGIKLTSKVKANRRAAANLLRKHGDLAVYQAIKIVAQARYNEYAPSVANFVDLQMKWTQVHLWAEKRAHAALLEKYESLSIEDRVAFKQANPELAKIIKLKRESM